MRKNLVVVDFAADTPNQQETQWLIDAELRAFYGDEPFELVSRPLEDAELHVPDVGMEMTKRALELARTQQADYCAYVLPVMLASDDDEEVSGVVFTAIVTPRKPIAMIVIADPPEYIPPKIRRELDIAHKAIGNIYDNVGVTYREMEISNGLGDAIWRAYDLLPQYLDLRQ